jgi:hypothetical protein
MIPSSWWPGLRTPRAEGDSLAEAAIGASRDRLRAVLLTSLTTIGGLLPLLYEKSLQAQFLLPMAITIVFGLAMTTLLVLFLVPALVGIGDDIARRFSYIYGRQLQRERSIDSAPEPGYERQNRGRNSTSTVNSSSRPSSIPAASSHFWRSLSDWKFPDGPMISPRPGPTFESAVPAPESGGNGVEPAQPQQDRQHHERSHEQEEEAHHRGDDPVLDRLAVEAVRETRHADTSPGRRAAGQLRRTPETGRS